ncbi:flagellar biosynthesis anti-sigma factor FlgM [Lysobacter yangpyeongensis]|uniref:Negative regulator of flagellin synthesis n=1 Tax=Lysobacter yangpyeongensis TaxID=346182 RepID=A0ABW0SIY9_9GAMM
MTHKIEGASPAVRPAETVATSAAQRAGAERAQSVSATGASESVRLTGEAESLQALERQLGSAPAGIDMARVNALRSAIADGTYRVDAEQIATRMLDFDRALTK